MAQSQKPSTGIQNPAPNWWQQLWIWLLTILPIITGLLIIGVFGLIFAGYWFAWSWAGLTSYTDPTGDYHPDKTLWDWLSLLFVPVVIGTATYWFRRTEQDLERQRTEQRTAEDRRRAEERAETERQAAEKRAETEREIAADVQRETALQAYLDRMTDLLLERGLRASEKDTEVRVVARTLTLAVLPRLDRTRKGTAVRFLYEARLIDKNKPIVILRGADLREANLRVTNLLDADLSEADLRQADLVGSMLDGANLFRADLRGAYLREAEITEADLHQADLREADLRQADLSGANLRSTRLNGAIMPDGTIYVDTRERDEPTSEVPLYWSD